MGRRDVLREVSLSVAKGSVFGLIGPNGAGKTTTIRAILGLLPTASGTIRIFDSLGATARRRVGSCSDAPGFYPHLTAEKNLRLLASVRGDERDPREHIARLGLESNAHQKVRTFSRGMVQRLGLAASLIGAPDLLVLDEPTSALDPSGVHLLRALILELRELGTTVFVSSHQLAELEMVCDEVAFLKAGEVRFQGPVSSLTSGVAVVVRLADPTRAVQTLERHAIAARIESGQVVIEHDDPAVINELLASDGLFAEHVGVERRSLGDVYDELMGDR